MKKFNVWLLAMLLVAMPVLQSCDDDDGYPIGAQAGDWATVRVTGGDNYSLTADDWGTLWPVVTEIPWYKPVDGQRVITFFDLLYDDFEGYDHGVKVWRVFNILTKVVEDMTPADEEAYGNDPVFIYKDGGMWISGGYLNVVFRQNLPKKDKHRVSLVRNMGEEDPNDGYIHLEYRYNTYGDTSDSYRDGAVSFNLKGLDVTSDTKGIKVKINSIANGEVELTFDLEDQPAPESAKGIDFATMNTDMLQ